MPFIPPPIPAVLPTSGWIVSAPLIVIVDVNGQQAYLYVGSPVPDGLSQAELNRLAALNFITRG